VPLGSIEARRSLLSLDNLATAIDCVLATPGPMRRPLIVADPDPLSVAQMIAALRRGLGRRPGLVRVPPWLVKTAMKMAGRLDTYDRLATPLVADASALVKLGWAPQQRTASGLENLARAS
jgi:nucleoside-diphosphate-sugar epimerase